MLKKLLLATGTISLLVPLFASAGSCPNLTRNLAYGSRGSDVIQLQQFLILQNLLASDSAAGYFGKLTQSAVQKWQCQYGIVCSGLPSTNGYGAVGARTRAAIAAACASPSASVGTSKPTDSTGGGNGDICTPLMPQSQSLVCPAGQNGSITQTRTSSCPGPTWGAWQTSANTCTTTPQTCTWNGQTISSGQSITAYQSSSVAYGKQCVSEQRLCTNGTLSGSYQYVSCSVTSPPISNAPLIGAFRWDAWWPDNHTVFPQYIPANLYTDWSYRQPIYGWFDVGVANAQAIMDQEIIDAADHGLDFWAFDNYAYIQDVPQISNQKPLYEGFKEYLASPNKNRLKFAIAISPGESSAGGYIGGYWNSGEVPYLVSQFKDPQYLKVNGDRPVLFVLGAKDIAANFPNWPQDHAFLNKQSEAAGLGDPIIIDTSMDVISSKNSGLDGLTTYGVMGNGAKPESGCTNDAGNPTPHCPFSSQSTKDESNWATAAQSGLLTVPGLTPVNDPRALTTPYGFYVDQPTYTQWEQEVKDAFAFMKTNVSKTNPPIAVIYAWNELNEGGPGIIPTKQNGMMYLDAIKAVKSGTYPSNYQDIYNGDNTAISLAANPGYPNHWTNYFPVSAAGYFNNDEEISQGIGESATLSVDNVTGFEVKATKGPNRGKMQVFIDGVSQGTVNVNSATWLPGQSVFKSSTLSPGTHVLKLYNVSTDEGATSIGIDQILVSKSR